MDTPIRPSLEARRHILRWVRSEMDLCYTCQTCAAACPINRSTQRLSPARVVRLAVFGQIDELLGRPEVWFCLGCNACAHDCPMTVKPGRLLAWLRREAICRGLVSVGRLKDYGRLWAWFHRVRWTLAAEGTRDGPIRVSDHWAGRSPAPDSNHDRSIPLRLGGADSGPSIPDQALKAGLPGCFTCGECRAACPVFRHQQLFDPLAIFRLANMGAWEELLPQPGLWLCLACRNCAEACCQKVRGHEVIAALRDLAVAQGEVSAEFPEAWPGINLELFPYLIQAVGDLFGFGSN